MSVARATKVRLRFVTADPGTAAGPQSRLTAGWDYLAEEPMLDGPVTRTVAVIDIDPVDGSIVPGARFVPPADGRVTGRYAIADESDPTAPDFQQVTVFTAVLRTILMFEEPDALGRKVSWAFDGEQLLVVPRAGEMANAFYHRQSRSLQFFFFDALIAGEKVRIYTCVSPDIVAHECAHAVIDGVVPDLYDSLSPQSLALHESIADLCAVLAALRSRELVAEQLEHGGGDLAKALAFARIAEQFGTATGVDGAQALRFLLDEASLSPRFGKVVPAEPHALSTVLSGALYALLLDMHERQRQALATAAVAQGTAPAAAPLKVSGLALFSAQQRLKRMALRALDYLPPAEVSFADFGRAVIAADAASNPGPSPERDFLAAQLVLRGIVARAAELAPVPSRLVLPADLDLGALVASDWVAYRFVEQFRDELFVPKKVAFTVRPRLAVEKSTWRSTGDDGPAQEHVFREVILKVGWHETRPLKGLGGIVDDVSVAFGTTLVIDADTRDIRALLSTGARHPSQKHRDSKTNATMRAAYLERCLDDGSVTPGEGGAELAGTTLQVRGLGRMLHLEGRT